MSVKLVMNLLSITPQKKKSNKYLRITLVLNGGNVFVLWKCSSAIKSGFDHTPFKYRKEVIDVFTLLSIWSQHWLRSQQRADIFRDRQPVGGRRTAASDSAGVTGL